MISRQQSLSRNIVQFCRFLRLKGFTIGMEEEAIALSALQFIDLKSRYDFFLVLKSICCRSRYQQHEFGYLFEQYWQELDTAVDSRTRASHKAELKPKPREAGFKSLKSWLTGKTNDGVEKTAAYSVLESFSQKDFSAVPSDTLEEMMDIIKLVSKNLANQLNRRYKKSQIKNKPDMRATLRRNLRHGGELMEIVYQKPKPTHNKLVILCDVSESMELYSAFLLQFLFAFQQVYRRVETFTFSTSLQCLTGLLKRGDFKEVLAVLAAQQKNWSGGTKIGESLRDFIVQYGGQLDNKSTLIILSDGWDTGAIEVLQQSMEILKFRSKKIIWLNPLMGYYGYQPDVAGMRAALPYISVLAPVHNVDSLRKLAQWL